MRHAAQLEPRRLFATVAQGFPGYYRVTGGAGDDVISIEVDRSAGTFTLDGVTYPGVQHVLVIAGDGNDTVSVVGTGTGIASASIRGGAGDDHLSLNMDGGVWGDDGRDSLHLRNAFRGAAVGGTGDDSISLAGECIDAHAEGNAGNDTLWAVENLYGVVLFGGAGNDRLYGSRFNDVIYDGTGSDYVFCLEGNDEVDSRDGEPDWVMGGDGGDTLWCDPREGGIHGFETVFLG